ncbi:MAG: aminopeptidase [Actinomycetes bacterium]
MDERFHTLAELAVHGANVQPGQVVALGPTVGQEELARAIAEAAYKRGARFVDVAYFDPYVKRARIAYANEDTLDFVPPWYANRLVTLGERGDARIGFAGIVAPDVLNGLDPARLGRDMLPWLKEASKVIDDRSTNWTIVPCPHPAWAKLVYPGLDPDAAYEKLWQELWHVLRLDEPDPGAAWEQRMATLKTSAKNLTDCHFDRLEFKGPGTELAVGLLPTGRWLAADFETRNGLWHMPNIPTEEVFTTPDPTRTEGYVTSTKPLVLKDGAIVRGLKVRFEGGRAVEVEAEENGVAMQSKVAYDDGSARLGEVALVDRHGRIGPLGTVFYDTLLDENAASHIALGNGFPFAVEAEDAERVNVSGIHIDFMIGSPEMVVTGVTASGERIPVLVGGDWQI